MEVGWDSVNYSRCGHCIEAVSRNDINSVSQLQAAKGPLEDLEGDVAVGANQG
jgi:hypothetical protein